MKIITSIQELEDTIRELTSSKDRVIIGFDGQSFVGKTTLAIDICKKIKGLQHIQLDSFLTPPQQRIAAIRDITKRNRLFEYWYDQEKIQELLPTLTGHILIEGTFLCNAIPTDKLDVLYMIKRDADVAAKRICNIMKKASLSKEEAEALDAPYAQSWSTYSQQTQAIPAVLSTKDGL